MYWEIDDCFIGSLLNIGNFSSKTNINFAVIAIVKILYD